MISPIKTVVENCTDKTINYRFSSVQIYLNPAGMNGSKFVCSGDLFTRMENNVESELLVIDALNGRISITYECDTRFAVRDAEVSPLVLSMSARNKIRTAQKALVEKKPVPLTDSDTNQAPVETTQPNAFDEVGAAEEQKSVDAVNAADDTQKSEPVARDGFPDDLPMGKPSDRAYAGMFEQTKVPVTNMKTVDMVSSKTDATNAMDSMAGHPDTLKVVDIGADKPKRGRRQVK